MQPGEAYYTLNAVLKYLSRQFSTDPGMLAVVSRGQEACDALFEHLNLQPLTQEETVPYLAALNSLKESVKPVHPQPVVTFSAYAAAVKQTEAARPAASVIVDADRVLKVLDSMIADFDEAPEAAKGYVNGIKPTVLDMREKIGKFRRCTEKQASYVNNMRRGLDSWFASRRDSDTAFINQRDMDDDLDDIPF